MANQVFVSYSRDNDGAAKRIVSFLDALGFSCWIDVERIRFGRFDRIIEDAIGGCDAFILLVSPQSVSSDWVFKELSFAHGLGKPLVPVEIAPTELSDAFEHLIGEIQRIPDDHNAETGGRLVIVEALAAEGLEAKPMDLDDPRFVLGRRLFDRGDFRAAAKTLESLLSQRPLHVAAVSSLITTYYNLGHARILDEEQRGVRPRNQPEMVAEFIRAEEVATSYMEMSLGDASALFRSQVWMTLGMLSAFVGNYDDAFKRLESACVCDGKNSKAKAHLDTLRAQLGKKYTRGPDGREREIDMPFDLPFPEPGAFSSDHSITFPFTVLFKANIPDRTATPPFSRWGPVMQRPEMSVEFPDGLSEDWKRLWTLDHNLGQLERLDSGDNSERILKESLKSVGQISSPNLAMLGWRRIGGAAKEIRLTGDGLDRVRSEAQRTLENLRPVISTKELMHIWNP